MKVFISWSGEGSRALAEALRDWLPSVIQVVEPFVSAKDIDKGANWSSELARELQDTEFGIVCLAADNLASPWLHYEAGSLQKSVTSRVCPVLLGVEKDDVAAPMNQLQMTSLDPADMLALVASVNKAAGSPLTESGLAAAVDVWWPRLNSAIAQMKTPVATAPAGRSIGEPQKPRTSQDEVLQEILATVRELKRSASSRSGGDAGRTRGRMSPSPVDLSVRAMLANAGIGVLDSRSTAVSSSFLVTPLPATLPGEVKDAIAELARSAHLEISLHGEDGGRSVSFDVHGVSDDPPF